MIDKTTIKVRYPGGSCVDLCVRKDATLPEVKKIVAAVLKAQNVDLSDYCLVWRLDVEERK